MTHRACSSLIVFSMCAGLAGVTASAGAQSASAPLFVTATVVSTCRVAVPSYADESLLERLPVALTCTRGVIAGPIVQQFVATQRTIAGDALAVIDF